MRHVIAQLVLGTALLIVLLAIAAGIAGLIARFQMRGLQGLLDSDNPLPSLFQFRDLLALSPIILLPLALGIARRLLGHEAEDMWLFRLIGLLFPTAAGIERPHPGDHVALTRTERLRRADAMRRLQWFFYGIIAIVLLGLIGWLGSLIHARLIGAERFNAYRAARPCLDAVVEAQTDAVLICRDALIRFDEMRPMALAGKLYDPDRYWLYDAEVALFTRRTDCAHLWRVAESVGRIADPDSMDRARRLVDSLRQGRLRDALASCDRRDALLEQPPPPAP